MKKFSKIGKRVIAFFLVALMNINAYATSASNDGSQFVTKADFDDLVQEFNNQMDSYQAGLNAKIDNAISRYLAGASGTKQEKLENLDNQVKNYDRKYTTFWNYPAKGFTDSNKNNYGKGSAAYYIQYGNNNPDNYSIDGRLHNNTYESSGVAFVDFPNNPKNALYYLKGNMTIADSGSGYNNLVACLETPYAYSDQIQIILNESFISLTAGKALNNSGLKSGTNASHTVTVENKDGEAGIYQNAESTKVVSYTLDCAAQISETWEKYTSLVFNGAGYPSCNAVGSQTLYCVDYDKRTNFNGDQVTIENVQGSTAGGKLHSWKPGSGTYYGSVELNSGFKWTFKYYNHKIFEVDANKLSNYGASLVASKPVRLYNGTPLTRVSLLGEVNFSCTVTNSAGNDTYLTISDEPFDNDDRYSTKEYTAEGKTYDHILLNQKLTSGAKTDIKFDVTYLSTEDKAKGRILYYRLSQETSTDNTVNMVMDISGDIMLKKS